MKEAMELMMRADAIIYEATPDGKRPATIDSTKLYNNIREIATCMTGLIQSSIGNTGFDRIAASVERVIPTAAVIAYVMGKPLSFIDIDKRSIQGLMVPGNVILPVDDIIGSEDKPRKVVNSIVASGGVVKDYVCILDEDRGARAALQKMGIRAHALLTLSDLFAR
jgi:orotate phosphoribosyltransferase